MKDSDLLLSILIAGQQRPFGVLRSSLYPLLEKDAGLVANQLVNDVTRFDVADIDTIGAQQMFVDFIELRNTQIKYEANDELFAAQMVLDSIELRATQIKYIAALEEVISANQIAIDSIQLQKTLVKYVDSATYQINAVQITLDNITLS